MIEAYANSLFSLAKEENLLDEFYNYFSLVDDLLKDKKIQAFFTNRFVSKEKLISLIETYFQEFNQYFKNFLYILVKDNVFYELDSISEEYVNLYYKEKNIEIGTIYGLSIDEADLLRLEKAFSKKLNKQVKLNFVKDESLIAGYKVKINSFIYDKSYKHELELLKQTLKEA